MSQILKFRLPHAYIFLPVVSENVQERFTKMAKKRDYQLPSSQMSPAQYTMTSMTVCVYVSTAKRFINPKGSSQKLKLEKYEVCPQSQEPYEDLFGLLVIHQFPFLLDSSQFIHDVILVFIRHRYREFEKQSQLFTYFSRQRQET